MGVGVLFIPEPWCPSATDLRPFRLDVGTLDPTSLAHNAVLVSHRPACWNDETSSRIRSRSPGPSSPDLRRVDSSLVSWAFPPAPHPAVTSDARGGGDRSGTLT